MSECQPNALILYQGYSSLWNEVDWLSLSFGSDTMVDFTNFSAKLKIGNFVFTNDDLTQEWIINLTAEQTATLPLGMNTASLIVYDTLGEGKPFSTNIPILVKNWVAGDVDVDTYKATITATLDDKAEFKIKIETARVSLEWVEEKISEHNLSESAHPYIQDLVDNERTAREQADSRLSQDILTEKNRAIGEEEALNRKIVNERNMRIAQDNALYGEIVYETNRATRAEQEIRDSIPTVYDGVLTIIQKDEVIGRFSANQSGNTEITIKAGDSIVNVDGGTASSIYLFEQIIDGGNA